MTPDTPKIIATVTPDKEHATSILKSLSLWDLMPPAERDAFVERGEVWDTVPGRELIEIAKMAKDVVE